MKSLKDALTITLVFLFTGCTKADFFPDPLGLSKDYDYEDPGLDDDYFTVSGTLLNINNYKAEVKEENGGITLPTNKKITLSVKGFSREVKDVEWIANGTTIAKGNNVDATLSSIGLGILNVKFKEVESGKKHNKEIKLYAFKQLNLSVEITPNNNICGEVAVGVSQTLTSYGNEKIGAFYLENSVQNICTSGTNKSARIARIPISVYDNKTNISIDLIEPQKTTTKDKVGFCLLFFCLGSSSYSTTVTPKKIYGTDVFYASTTKNLTPGKYKSGNTTLMIEDY